MDELRIFSSAFQANDQIPNGNIGYGKDKSPELTIEGLPDAAALLVVTLDDLGHPI